jgi:hypothetical protein
MVDCRDTLFQPTPTNKARDSVKYEGNNLLAHANAQTNMLCSVIAKN